MSDSAAFAVPKDRLTVTIRLSNGTVHAGDIFLDHYVSDLPTHQKVTLFLDSSNTFFPIAAGGPVEFVNKCCVLSMEIALPDESPTVFYSPMLMHTIPIVAWFEDGSFIRGELIAEVPEEKARLSDCLNLPGRFLAMRSNGKMLYLGKKWLHKVVHDGKT